MEVWWTHVWTVGLMRCHLLPIVAKFFGYNIHDVRSSIFIENECPNHEQLRPVLKHFHGEWVSQPRATEVSCCASSCEVFVYNIRDVGRALSWRMSDSATSNWGLLLCFFLRSFCLHHSRCGGEHCHEEWLAQPGATEIGSCASSCEVFWLQHPRCAGEQCQENEWPSYEQLRSVPIHFPAKFLLPWV